MAPSSSVGQLGQLTALRPPGCPSQGEPSAQVQHSERCSPFIASWHPPGPGRRAQLCLGGVKDPDFNAERTRILQRLQPKAGSDLLQARNCPCHPGGLQVPDPIGSVAAAPHCHCSWCRTGELELDTRSEQILMDLFRPWRPSLEQARSPSPRGCRAGQLWKPSFGRSTPRMSESGSPGIWESGRRCGSCPGLKAPGPRPA